MTMHNLTASNQNSATGWAIAIPRTIKGMSVPVRARIATAVSYARSYNEALSEGEAEHAWVSLDATVMSDSPMAKEARIDMVPGDEITFDTMPGLIFTLLKPCPSRNGQPDLAVRAAEGFVLARTTSLGVVGRQVPVAVAA